MTLPPGFLDEIRGRVRVSEVIGRRVSWDARRSNAAKGDWWACCPFHKEKSPSFHVDDRRGFYHCFGCGAKGDAVSFLRDREGLAFMEAVEELARMAGLEMPARDPEAAAQIEKRRGLAEWMEEAVRFYRAALAGPRAAEARAYFARRGVGAGTVVRFELGYAPDARDALLEHLTGKGASAGELIEAGLVARPEGGGTLYDRFRDRVMFPIRDARGRCVAFGGRALSPNARAKYLNSPETPLFQKSRVLFNHGPARAAAQASGTLVVAEGYMDVIALAEAGFEHAVAPLGTAVTEAHLDLIWSLAPEPVIALDGDAAGRRAASRVADIALPKLEAGRSLRFALMPEGRDPDDLIRAEGAEAMRAVLDRAEPMSALLWRRETEGRSFDSPERRAALDARLKELLGRIPDRGLREHYRRDFADRRAELFAPPRRSEGGGRIARPRGGGARGRGAGFALSPAPLAETVSSLLARVADVRVAARGREAAMLLALARHPALVERWMDEVAAATFLNSDLDALRNRLISTLFDPSEGRDSDLPAAIERAAPGAAICFARVGADPESVEKGLVETIRRHAAEAALAREIREAVEALSEGPGAELDGRLREVAALAQRDRAGTLDEDDGDDAAVSRELREAIAKQIWVRPKRGRAGPNH